MPRYTGAGAKPKSGDAVATWNQRGTTTAGCLPGLASDRMGNGLGFNPPSPRRTHATHHVRHPAAPSSLPSSSLGGSLPGGSLTRGFIPRGFIHSGSMPGGSLPGGADSELWQSCFAARAIGLRRHCAVTEPRCRAESATGTAHLNEN